MHKGVKHTKVMEGYNDFARSEGAEAKKYVDSVRTNDPFAEGVDDMMDEESRRRERGFYVKGTTISKEKGVVDTPALPKLKRLTDKDIDRKLSKADRKLSKINSSNSDSKNERKLSKANKALNQVEASINRKQKPVGEKTFGDNMFTTPVTKSPLGMMKNASPFEMSCWKGYEAKGQKPSPSGKKTSSGKIKMVNNCVKK
jgi:hypothetical protein|tara:strand:+ start:2052 stop:2651 length:600 start_codon:yes stop_codon:yes gene_type:complete